MVGIGTSDWGTVSLLTRFFPKPKRTIARYTNAVTTQPYPTYSSRKKFEKNGRYPGSVFPIHPFAKNFPNLQD